MKYSAGPWKCYDLGKQDSDTYRIQNETRIIGLLSSIYSNAKDQLQSDAVLISYAPKMHTLLSSILEEQLSHGVNGDQVLIKDIESLLYKIESESK